MAFTSKDVMALREKTGVGMMDCKKALQESDGDMEKALAYFDKGFEHHKEYCRISEAGEYHYSAPLVEKVTLQAGQFQEIPENFWEIQMPQFTEEFCEELKKNPKYSECFK